MTFDFTGIDQLYSDIEKETPVLYVRITTCYYHDKKGAHMRRDIIPLKRKSTDKSGYIFEDWDMMGSCEEYFKKASELEDGIYEVKYYSSTDWETGYVDDVWFEFNKAEV